MSEHEAGRALDALIARGVMGWPVYETYDDFHDSRQDGSERVYPVCFWNDQAGRYAVFFADDDLLATPFAPSVDIRAAWLIVERIGGYFMLQKTIRTDRFGFQPSTWYCAFAAPRRFEVSADTAPLAICNAALVRVEDALATKEH